MNKITVMNKITEMKPAPLTALLISLFSLSLAGISCDKAQVPLSPAVVRDLQNVCAPLPLKTATNVGATGTAKVFSPDPITRSGDPELSPVSVKLDDFIDTVQLAHLNGTGVLKGSYVEVLNGIKCGFKFGAFDAKNQFTFPHSDWRFQEAMAYYFGDSYQTYLESIGYLRAGGAGGQLTASAASNLPGPVQIVAHCELNDNAYFQRGTTSTGKTVEQVCLGDSVRTPGAFYGDDAIVTVHELEHATTTDNYSPVQELNQFFYDEAGSLNEAISDVMGLIYTAPLISSVDKADGKLDPRVFSRWALGTFDPRGSHLRGAHKCPTYDSHYPNCDGFPGFSIPQASNAGQSVISYVYPDGMGWPYSTTQKGGSAVRKTFLNYLSQEEIHNGGILMVGALWDVYSALKSNHAGDEVIAQRVTSQLILEAVKHLPPPNSTTNHSPVTYLGFSALLVAYAPLLEGVTLEDQAAIQTALKARGLYDSPTITTSDWLAVGSGTQLNLSESRTPGLFVADDPELLGKWLGDIGADPGIVTQSLGTGLNYEMDPGETVAVWFDLQNNADLTAGGVLVTVTSPDPDLEILDQRINIGYMSRSGYNQTQIMYGKINGKAITRVLNQDSTANSIPIGNTYFKTNPFFNRNSHTAIWMRVHPNAAHGKIVNLQVDALPANGVASSRIFPVKIQE